MKGWKSIIALALAFEAITCVFRFSLGLQSTRDTGFLGDYTFGFRIHHGYLGLLLLVLVAFLPEGSNARTWGRRTGWALVLSDLIHHFAVLWPITGDPAFHFRYPGH